MSKRKWSPNPSKKHLPTDDRVLKNLAFKAPSYKYRRNLLKMGGIDNLPVDYGCCWICWIRITGEGLNDWRVEPFSEMKEHPDICPLCEQEHWRGRIWYPKRYLMYSEIGNPSRRDNKGQKIDKRMTIGC